MVKVIVVDDDPEVVALLVLVLQQERYDVLGFTSAKDALDVIMQDPPGLVLADVLMPELGGVDLCKAIKRDPSTASVPVILLSGSSHLTSEVVEAGAAGGLSKPFDLDSVLRLARAHAPLAQTTGS